MGKHNTPNTRSARIAAVQAAHNTIALQVRSTQRAARVQAATIANQQAYMLAVQQLATQYGVPVPNTLSVRAVAGAQKHAPSTVQGACGIVRAWVAANPTATRAQALQHFAGSINPATVSTQYAAARKTLALVLPQAN